MDILLNIFKGSLAILGIVITWSVIYGVIKMNISKKDK